MNLCYVLYTRHIELVKISNIMSSTFQTLKIAIQTGNPYKIAESITFEYTNAEWNEILEILSKLSLHFVENKDTVRTLLSNIPDSFPIPAAYFATMSFRAVLIYYLPANKLATFANMLFGSNATKNSLPYWMFSKDGVFDFNLYIEIFHMLIGVAIERKIPGIIFTCLKAVSLHADLKDVVLSYYYTKAADHDMFDPRVISYFRAYDKNYRDNYLSKTQVAAVNAMYEQLL